MSGNCTGQRSEVRRVNTAPCVPVLNDVALNCSSKSAVVNWSSSGSSLDVFSVSAVSAQGEQLGCGIFNNRSCVVDGLQCGQTYTFSMNATQGQCTSASNTLQRETAPCPPLNIQSRMNCGNNTASVSWSRGNGALSYLTTLECSNGQTYMCRTNETGCDITNMTCGQTCSVKVVAEGRSCNSSVGTGSPIITAPCPNTGIQAKLDCRTNSALISWTPGNGALSFNATLQSFQDAQKHSCFTTGSSCNITSLPCGQHYNVSVTGYGQNCSTCSKPSVTLDTAPCVPTQVNVSLSCGSDTASVSWAASSGLVSYYIVTAEGDNGITLTCNSSSTSCNISGLACGQAYNVSVTAMSGNCTGQRSEVRRVNTAPCPPQNVSANMQCESGSVQVSWSPAVDASQFRVEMQSQITGVIFSCNSTNTQCSIANLTCGESFNISVVALRGSCQSQPSSGLNIVSAPCTPQGVNGTVDCVTNSAWVTWDVDKGAESYTVLAVGDDSQNVTCSSQNSTCYVPDLGCGKIYTFQVTASNAACLSPPSNSFQLETAPCTLSSIVVVAECQSSVIMVQWQRAKNGKSLYIATAEDQDHVFISCNSSASSCNLTNVQCGKEYTISVAASANKCGSLRSPTYKIRTAPCQPSQVQAFTDCQSKAVFVSWDPSYVAQSYLLTAVSRDGDLKTCNTSYNNCTLTDLHCSNTYNVSVLASNENCTSLPSTNVTFKTAPCKPANVTANIQCGNSSASLSWVGSTGAVAYVGIAQSENGTTVYCQNTEPSCTLVGLVCGTVYNFTVQATDGTCNSSLSEPLIEGAAPCPPAGLRVVPRTVVNDTQILRASWSTVSCPNSEYLLGLKGNIQGKSQALFDLASYWTSRTFFEIPLPCGSSYSATIRARKSNASSVESAAVTGITVPCAPLNVTFSASSAEVAWDESVFATNYTVYGVTSSSRTTLCKTSQLLCSITNFSSGHIVVTARNAAGESEDSVSVLVTPVVRR